jgi:hypothetical protein
MKRIAPLLFLITLNVYAGPHNDEQFAGSVLLTHPIEARLAIKNQSWLQYNFTKRGNFGGAFQITTIYNRSIPKKKNARYFLINDKNELLIAGDTSTHQFPRDVRAEWLGLPSNFSGNFSLMPTQNQFGAIFEYNQNVYNLVNIDFFKYWQIGLRFPLLTVEHHLHLQQQNVINPSPTAPTDILAAFNNLQWQASRMIQKQHKTGVGDLHLYLETPYYAKNHTIFVYRSGVVIPTSNKNDYEYVFSPLLGNNHRIAVNGAVDLQVLLNRDASTWAACFFMSLDGYYNLRTFQKRTFDLKKKPWSRFLLFNVQQDFTQKNIPGVNVLTRRAHIRPQTMAEFSTGWRFINDSFTGEFGYSAWGYDEERIEKIDEPFELTYGIAAPQALNDPVPKTASTSTISTLGPTDATFTPITLRDIDLQSGGAGGTLTHTFHCAIDTHKCGHTMDSFFGLGGFVELSQKNSSLSCWGLWVKLGATF